jgi:excisionase family DNA binding protein
MSEMNLSQKKELLTIREASDFLNCSDSTTKRLISEAAFRITRVRGTVRIYRTSIEAYLERQAITQETILHGGPINWSDRVKLGQVDFPDGLRQDNLKKNRG